MRDLLLIALFAFLGAAAAGLLGALVLRLLRHRSLVVSMSVVAGVAVTAMLAGTLTVAWAMFLSSHDLYVVTTVVAMAAAVSLVTAVLLGRWVAARSRELTLAARSFGDGGTFAPPAGQPTAELAALTRELAATSAKLDSSREREQALETSRREPSPGSRTICAHRWRGCGPWPRRWRTAWPPTPGAICGRYGRRWSA